MDFENILIDLKAQVFGLDSACRRLWDEDKAAAVPVEAASAELKKSITRIEKAFAEFGRLSKNGADAVLRAEQARESAVRALESELKLERSKAVTLQDELKAAKEGFERDMKAVNERCAAMKEEVHSLKGRLEAALHEASQLEDELVAAKEKSLNEEARREAERAGKMDALVSDLAAKERALEESWSKRRRELEERQKSLSDELRSGADRMEKIYALKESKLMELNRRLVDEFQEREGKARAMEEELRAHAVLAAEAAAKVAKDYERRRAELEEEKRKALEEIAAAARRQK